MSRLPIGEVPGKDRKMVLCFSCGAELVPTLGDAGSLRCQDCRDGAAPLRPHLVNLEPTERPVLTLIRTLPVRTTAPFEPPPLAAA
jgi:hypothetical protein